MNLELFIAKKIHFGEDQKKKISSPAIKIATAGVALGLAAMILSVSIVIGFKKEVRNKVIGFGAHIQITNFDSSTSYETEPICVTDSLLTALRETKGIKHVELYATKPGIIKTDSDFQGVVLKGVNKDYDWSFFKQHLVAGNVLNRADSSGQNQIIISKYIADRLHLKVDDHFITYFVQEQKARKFVIKGIYNTDFNDYDKFFVITDIDIIKKLSGWDDDQVSGIELTVNDFSQLNTIAGDMYYDMMPYRDREGNTLYTRSIKDINPSIFHWLDLLDINPQIIIILMLAVSGFTMISGLLILILERTNMIGILKAMGAKNKSIRKTFLYVASFIILKGIIWGNVIALLICFIQKQFGVIKLDPSIYYVSQMPIDLNIATVILINIGTLVVSMLMMLGPSYLIARISPAKSIRYE